MSFRALHYVMKITDRQKTVEFLRDVLGMRALRHEEFEGGCKAFCNGPYDNKWSRTLFGYGPEDRNFALELAYNYGVKHYRYGNDLGYVKVLSKAAFKTAQDQGLGRELDMNVLEVRGPDGHTFRLINEEPSDAGPLASLCLHVTSLEKAAEFWCDALGLLEVDKGDAPAPFITLSTGADQATLRLQCLPEGERMSHGTGYGRVAYGCPREQLGEVQEEVAAKGFTVLTPRVRLDTPGKASVDVVILADPDGHEVCLVGDEAFRELSRLDESAPQLLGKAIAKDDSAAWFEERGKRRRTEDAPAPAPPLNGAGGVPAAAKSAGKVATAAAAPAPAGPAAAAAQPAGAERIGAPPCTYAAAAAKSAGAAVACSSPAAAPKQGGKCTSS